MESRKDRITHVALIGGIALVLILMFGTIWVGRSAKADTETAVRSVSLLYLDELAGRREQVVAENMQDKINVIHTALELMTEDDLSDSAHLQAYQAKMKQLFVLERFAFVDTDGRIYTAQGIQTDIDQYRFDYHSLAGPESPSRTWRAKTKR